MHVFLLHCCELVEYDTGQVPLPSPVLWDRLRQAFSCVCLPVRRLHLTAQVWSALLLQVPTAERTPNHSALVEAADWIATADVVDWLSTSPQGPVPRPTTFQQGARLLDESKRAKFFLPTPMP